MARAHVGRDRDSSGTEADVDARLLEILVTMFRDLRDRRAAEGWNVERPAAVTRAKIGHDTAEFAVASVRRWWQRLGKRRYPRAKRLSITADCGGSNSPRTRLWRVEVQRFANETGMVIEVCHYPPGTSKWNKIEHRLFCHITRNWQGIPLDEVDPNAWTENRVD